MQNSNASAAVRSAIARATTIPDGSLPPRADRPLAYPHVPAGPTETRAQSIARLADLLVERRQEGGDVHHADLVAAGFKPSQIEAWLPEAKRIADTVLNRQDAPEEQLSTRQKRVAEAVGHVVGLFPAEAPTHFALRRAGFSNAEIGELSDEIAEGVKLALCLKTPAELAGQVRSPSGRRQ